MSMISEQVKELKTIANNLSIGHNMPISLAIERFRKAADTIEALSAKLQAANMGRTEKHYTIEQIIDAITQDAANIMHYAKYQDRDGLKNELTQYLSSKYKQAEDFDGWVYCGDGKNLPVVGKRYQVTAVWKDGDFEKRSVYDAVYGSDGIWHGRDYIPVPYEVIAWQPLPEPYHEP